MDESTRKATRLWTSAQPIVAAFIAFFVGGVVTIQVSVTPALDPKHKIQVTLDGKPIGPPASGTSFNLSNVDRGTHTLGASILDESGTAIRSSTSVTFHMRRPTVFNNINRNQP